MEIEYEKATSMTIEECEKEIMELDREILEKKQKRELLAQKKIEKLPSVNDRLMNKRKLETFLETDLINLRDIVVLLGGIDLEEEKECSDDQDTSDDDINIKKFRKQYKIKDEAVRLSKSLGVEYVS